MPTASPTRPGKPKHTPDPARAAANRKTGGAKSKPRQKAPKVTDEDRAARSLAEDEKKSDILAFVREHGEIDADQAAEVLGVTRATAAAFLRSLTSGTPLNSYNGEKKPGAVGRPPKVYRLEAAPSNGVGAKTRTEERILDSVTTDGPIDAGTLAFNVGMNTNDTRKVVDGLVNRGVLKRSTEEGVTLYEVAS